MSQPPHESAPTAGDTPAVDPAILEVVEQVRDRFGTQGLADLIALAREELAAAEAALKGLAQQE